jgi:hypothetical protein
LTVAEYALSATAANHNEIQIRQGPGDDRFPTQPFAGLDHAFYESHLSNGGD